MREKAGRESEFLARGRTCQSPGERPTENMARRTKNPKKPSVAAAQKGTQVSRWDEERDAGRGQIQEGL